VHKHLGLLRSPIATQGRSYKKQRFAEYNEGHRPQGLREMAYQPQEIFFRSSAPVTIDEDKCIAEKGCTVCVEVCPMDLLAINPATQKAYMAFDECWYCMPCEKDCPTGAVKVDIPYLLR